MMDHAEKIKKAIQILGQNRVSQNLTYLVDGSYSRDLPDVFWDNEFRTKDVEGAVYAQRFIYNRTMFELVAVNDRFTFDGDENWSDFIVTVEGERVLTATLVTKHKREYTYRQVSISEYHLKQFKVGGWIELLQEVCEKCRENWEKVKVELERDRLAKKARELDLGDIGA